MENISSVKSHLPNSVLNQHKRARDDAANIMLMFIVVVVGVFCGLDAQKSKSIAFQMNGLQINKFLVD